VLTGSSWKCGIDLGAAREKVRTARALEKLPLISAAMERGEIRDDLPVEIDHLALERLRIGDNVS
jgi:hypothetical protein